MLMCCCVSSSQNLLSDPQGACKEFRYMPLCAVGLSVLCSTPEQQDFLTPGMNDGSCWMHTFCRLLWNRPSTGLAVLQRHWQVPYSGLQVIAESQRKAQNFCLVSRWHIALLFGNASDDQAPVSTRKLFTRICFHLPARLRAV